MAKTNLSRENFFMYHGEGPWKCYRCGEWLFRDEMYLHHIDGNNKNNESLNLVPIHQGCHVRLHGVFARLNKSRIGVKSSPEVIRKRVETLRARRLMEGGQ